MEKEKLSLLIGFFFFIKKIDKKRMLEVEEKWKLERQNWGKRRGTNKCQEEWMKAYTIATMKIK